MVIILSIITLTCKSQDTTKIPIPVAKQIITDLRTGDSAKALLPEVSKALYIADSLIIEQKKSLYLWSIKDIKWDNQLRNEKMKFEFQSEYVNQLEKDNKKLKTKLLFNKIIYGTAILGLGYLYITK